MNDRDFEQELFALYGEASQAWPDDGVTRRVMQRIARADRLRSWILAGGVIGGAGGTLAAAAAFASPMIGQLAARIGAPPPVLWALIPATALLVGWATIRLAAND